jgi:hypothetical protein
VSKDRQSFQARERRRPRYLDHQSGRACLKFVDMGSHMKEYQLIVQLLDSLPNDYELQSVLTEECIENKENQLSIDNIRRVKFEF